MSDRPDATHVIRLPDRTIGEGEPCFIIAEAGINHNGRLDLALKLVDMAVAAGADAVKFQKRHLPSIYPSELLEDTNRAEWSFQYLLPVLQETELTDDEFRQIDRYCHEQGIRFMCTPWDEQTLEFLETLEVDIYKVASADLINLPLLRAIAATGKPMIVSTGMATREEIEVTAAFLAEEGASFALLHAVSTYPAPFEGLNLRFIDELKKFSVPVGYSSHERGIAMPLAAVALGASIIEKHITLDRTLPGPDHPASIERAGIERMVRDIRNLELALGDGHKELSAMELQNQHVLRKSLVAVTDIAAGTIVTPEMVTTKGPGKGLNPQRVDELIGVTMHRDLAADDYFRESDLERHDAVRPDTTAFKRDWGLKARFHDFDEVMSLKPELIELHFSEEDLDFAFVPPEQSYEQQLVIHAPEFMDQRLLDMADADSEWRERSTAVVQRTIDKATEMGRHFTGPVSVVVHVGGMSMDEPVTEIAPLTARAVESFRALDANGVVLLPENLPPRPWYLGGQWFQNLFTDPEQMIAFCEAVELPMTLDVSHAQLYCAEAGRDLGEYVSMCLPYSKHLHLADASGIDREGLQIGEGVIDWEQILSLLDSADFTWVPEIWSGHLNGHLGFLHALERLASYNRL
jgi:N-acetylneuraminate synthase